VFEVEHYYEEEERASIVQTKH